MYAGIQISGDAKEVRIGAQTITQIANNSFVPQIEVKTFPKALLFIVIPITVNSKTAAEGIAIVNAYETAKTYNGIP